MDDMRLYPGQSLRWHMDLVRRVYPRWDEAYATHLMQRFQLRPAQTLGGFSHGQRVKALLLLLLARHPRLLLLDEPTTGLDPVARGEVLDALGDVLRDEQRSIMFSSHNTAEVERIADVITFLHDGQVHASRDKEAFLDDWRRVLCRGNWDDAIKALPHQSPAGPCFGALQPAPDRAQVECIRPIDAAEATGAGPDGG